MKWILKTFLWASFGCVAAATPVSAQVTLGRPTPLLASGIRQASYIVRGASPSQHDEPKGLTLPKDLPELDKRTVPVNPDALPMDIVQPIGKQEKTFEKLNAPKVATPPVDTQEQVIILDGDSRFVNGRGRSLIGLDWVRGGLWYFQGEALAWRSRGFNVPPLVTTASANDPEATRGALGFGTTRLLFGDGNNAGGIRPGFRLTLGYQPDPCGLCSFDVGFFYLYRRNDGAFFDSNNTPVIGRSFFNLNTGAQDRELTTSPGTLPGDVFRGVGTLQVISSSYLWGAEANARCLIWVGDYCDLIGFAGFRYLELNDHLGFDENLTSLRDIPGNPGQAPISRAGDRILVFDTFRTRNRFYGGQLGLDAHCQRGPWSLDLRAKLGLGATHQTVDIDGGQRITSLDGRVQTFRGGLYALPSNIGHHSQTRFAFVPEVGLKVGYNVTDNVRIYAGYDFVYWSSVLRPGDQIDPVLDANTIPNSGAPFPTANQVRPRVPFRTTSYWAHGLNAGVEIRY